MAILCFDMLYEGLTVPTFLSMILVLYRAAYFHIDQLFRMLGLYLYIRLYTAFRLYINIYSRSLYVPMSLVYISLYIPFYSVRKGKAGSLVIRFEIHCYPLKYCHPCLTRCDLDLSLGSRLINKRYIYIYIYKCIHMHTYTDICIVFAVCAAN